MTDDRKQRADEPAEEEQAGRGFSGLVPDAVRRAVLTGMGALFMTEEGIRNAVTEMKLPKEALNFLLGQAEKTRIEVSRVVSQEVRRFLESETLRREVMKLLSSVTLEVSASIKLKPTGEPTIQTKVKARRDSPDADPVSEPQKP